MQVLFDLRPPHLVQLQGRQIDAARLLSVLFFVVFILFSGYNIFYTALNYLSVRRDLESATGEQISVRDESASLLSSINKIRDLKTRVIAYLAFTRNELPAVEFMKILEDVVPQGLKIATLEVRPESVLMVGSAISDEEIIALTTNLAGMSYIVKKVDAPVTNKSVMGTRQISDFRVTCDIKPILDIAEGDPNRLPPP
ncbi:MAG: PilN domain-containing protein, partial [Synergistaceae bacterium]|nr:PilN domain-containing protein [Synergistaceae bacterium]